MLKFEKSYIDSGKMIVLSLKSELYMHQNWGVWNRRLHGGKSWDLSLKFLYLDSVQESSYSI